MSGAMLMQQGASAGATVSPTVTVLSPITITAFGGSPVTVGLRFNPTGAVVQSSLDNSTYTTQFQWCAPTSLYTLFEVKAVQVSGDTMGGAALDTWLSVASTRTWTLAYAGGNTVYTTFTIGIRRVSTGEIVAQFTVDMAAGVT
jgi:hypothetical protein